MNTQQAGHLGQRLATIFSKGLETILGLISHVVSVVSAQLCSCGMKAAICL